MAEPKDAEEAVAFLLDCVRKGCLGDGDARAVRLLIADRKALMRERLRLAEQLDRLTEAADACLDLLETTDLEDEDGEGGRIQALRDALNDD